MRRFFRNTIFWWPAVWKAGLTCMVVALTTFMAQSDELSTSEVQAFTWWDWTKFCVPIVIVVVNNILAFLDRTMERLRTKDLESNPSPA